jgi:hypothetical protein
VRLSRLALALVILGGCAAAAPGPSRGAADCVALFRQYDVLANLFPHNGRRFDDRVASPPVAAQAQRLRSAGCITLTRDLAGMEGTAGQAADGGAAIAPISLHAGVVTSMADDARARAFFAGQGVPARSLGSAPLGRRIYLGPFATQEALDGARDLAFRAGFFFPYPVQF